METAERTFPVHVRTSWVDFSPALHWYTARKLEAALHGFASRIRSVSVRITNHEAHVDGRTCTIDVAMRPAGTVAVSASGTDLYDLVDRATETARARLQEHVAEAAAAPALSRIA